MITYLQKFNKLDPELKSKVSGEKAMAAMKKLEEKHGVKLATVVMRLMVKDVSILDLVKFLKFEYDMEARAAEELVDELKEKVLWEVAEYLDFSLDEEPKEKAGSFKSGLGANTIKTSDFFFSSEDEKEVKELTKKLEDFKPVKEVKEKKQEEDKSINDMAKAVREKMKMNFSANELNDRFEVIIKTYIKGVRNKVDSMQAMMKKVDSGGLDFDNTLASRALKIADEVKNNSGPKNEQTEKSAWASAPKAKSISASPGARAKTYSKMQAKGLRDVDYDFSSLKKKSQEKQENKESEKVKFETLGMQEINSRKIETKDLENKEEEQGSKDFKIDLEALKKLEQKKPEAKIASSATSLGQGEKQERPSMFAAPIKKIEEKEEGKVEPIEKEAEATSPAPGSAKAISASKPLAQSPKEKGKINISQPLQAPKVDPGKIEKIEDLPGKKTRPEKETNKPKVEDVKFVPRLTGPVDELKEMTLTDFRRLGINAQEITSVIIKKIDTLEKESYEQRSRAIKAWRESPVNRLYLELAKESINQKKKVNNLIVEWRQAGREVIKPEEFSAILNLNKRIRF